MLLSCDDWAGQRWPLVRSFSSWTHSGSWRSRGCPCRDKRKWKLSPPPPTPGASFCARRIHTPYQALDGSSKWAAQLFHGFHIKRQPGVPRSTFETQQMGKVGERHTRIQVQFCVLLLWALVSSSAGQSYSARVGNSTEEMHWRSWHFTDAKWPPPSSSQVEWHLDHWAHSTASPLAASWSASPTKHQGPGLVHVHPRHSTLSGTEKGLNGTFTR